MKTAIFLLLISIATSCAPVPHYGEQLYYRPKNSNSSQYVITGRIDVDPVFAVNKTVRVFVNETEVISGDLSPQNTGAFVGKYEGHIVNTSCFPKGKGIWCDVFIDSEKVGTF